MLDNFYTEYFAQMSFHCDSFQMKIMPASPGEMSWQTERTYGQMVQEQVGSQVEECPYL